MFCVQFLRDGVHTLRSPCCSAEPSSEVYFLLWSIERSASCEGAHVALCFCRHSSLSDARTDTTMVRWRAFSGVLVVYDMPSARCESDGWASAMAAVIASDAESWLVVVFSERTDIVCVCGTGSLPEMGAGVFIVSGCKSGFLFWSSRI